MARSSMPMADMDKPGHVKSRTLDEELPAAELFDKTGRLKSELAELAPEANRRMSANLHANGGLLLRD